MKTLEFLHPVFHGGFNTTVRKGTKWADLVSGEEIELVGAAGEKMGVATVVFAKTLHARKDQVAILSFCEFCNDPDSRDWSGIVQTMNTAYQEDGGWGPEVTVVGFMLPNRITLGESNIQDELETITPEDVGKVEDVLGSFDEFNPPATGAGENPNVQPLTTGGTDIQVTVEAPEPGDDPEKTA